MRSIQFQFLLVQLKGKSGTQGSVKERISIPSGSIKSQFADRYIVRGWNISIPSGSIKRFVSCKNTLA